MSELVDRKYVSIIGPRLDRFRSTGKQWNFRCPICGDSAKKKSKARGYFYSKGGRIQFYCHNCHASKSFGKFLKEQFPEYYKNYIVDIFGKQEKKPQVESKPVVIAQRRIGMKEILSRRTILATQISSLPSNHPASIYIKNRKIPEEFHRDIYFTDDFGKTILDFVPDYEKKVFKESRIVVPFYNENGFIMGFQGRALDENNPIKYITIKKNDDVSKVFGLERVDWTKPVFVVEGPFDSLFIPNCLATMDSTLTKINDYKSHDYIFVNDNEPRNKEVVYEYKREIKQGHELVIWPSDIQEKDINDMVLSGVNHIEAITNNIYTGLQATLELNKWKKI